MGAGAVTALITGAFAILVALIEVHGRANRRDHASVERHLDRIEGKIDRHIEGHANGTTD